MFEIKEEKKICEENGFLPSNTKLITSTSLGYSAKELRKEKKMRRRYKKQLIKYIKKNYKATDFYYIIAVLDIIVNDFYEYYNTGVNCYQVDATRIPIAEQLLEIKKDFELIKTIEEKGKIEDKTIEESSKIESKALKHLFSIFGEHIREWWD